MPTTYDVRYPEDMMQAAHEQAPGWAESTIHALVGSIEYHARARPLSFALWTFGIGFVLGWKLKPW